MLHLMIPHHSHLQTPPSEEEDPLDALDRVKEILADGDHPFPVDRKKLKEVIKNKLGEDVKRIQFLSSGEFGFSCLTCGERSFGLTLVAGTFHKVYTHLGISYSVTWN
jgi:hypothetical protein